MEGGADSDQFAADKASQQCQEERSARQDEENEKGREEGDEVEQEDEAGAPRTVNVNTPPCQDEINRHNAAHLPFRSWCPHCVKGKAKGKGEG